MTSLITGASGFIGQYLIKRLIKSKSKKDKIYCFVRDSNKIPKYLRKYVTILAGSDIEIKKYGHIVNQCHYIYHLAARPTLGNGSEYQKDNIDFTNVLVGLANKSKALRRFVFLSSVAAVDRMPNDDCELSLNENSVPNPLTDYGKSKLIAENILVKSKLPYVIIRPSLVYGPGMRLNSHLRVLIGYVQDNNPVSRLDFSGKVSLIYVEDLISIILVTSKSKESKRQVYFASSDDVTIGQLFLLIRKCLGKSDNLVNLNWLPVKQFQVFRRFLPLTVQGLFFPVLWTSSSKIRSLGFKPKYNICDQMLKLIHWHSTQKIDRQRIAVVTGGAGGIGLAIGKKLYARGYQLILIDKDRSSLRKVRNSLEAAIHMADLSNEEALVRISSTIFESGNVELLVNNAGIGYRKEFVKDLVEKHRSVLLLNCLAPLYLTHAFLTNKRSCQLKVINIISSSAFQPLPYMSVYSASKAFMLNWSLSLSGESRDGSQSFRVLTVCPSGTNTSFQSSAGVKTGRNEKLLSPEKVANLVCSAHDNNLQFIIIGLSGKLMSVLSRLLPYNLQVDIWRNLMIRSR